ncbi:Lrp/AsnC family transcriptional regulator [Phaeovulum sp.]|uniref:Lrp/AsnC family transcriptional regulator n=1 Tax=Phaeovulum sp. TaxID=2934796 RepID=UPI0027309FA0|nr:Lrp/AsnC family transcriptional regulator [Phaeovulum sp.]MDP1668020.1 Lrp/AsnC family transcriptional regulator [Phaeovulum sp.]MDZ4119469.1 Lrp/AsnC family transcriptional regulator [Phaeovulum sp.]
MDKIDQEIIAALQRDGGLSQRALAEKAGLSQNACWRRVQRLTDTGVLCGTTARIGAKALGLDLTVFMMVRTRHHNADWARSFRQRVEAIPEIVEMHRIGGDWDYLLKVVTKGMGGYDRVYQALISNLDLEKVTGFFSMETMLEGRPLLAPAGR